MIVTTTTSIEGYTIDKYFEPISANMVIGTNILSDFKASFTDFFGGRSGTYEKKIQKMYDEIIKQLEFKAGRKGANCLVGLRMDMGEISGKGTQMLMLSAYATPVLINSLTASGPSNTAERIVDGWAVDSKIKAAMLKKEDDKTKLYSDENIEFITQLGAPDFAGIVMGAIMYFKNEEVRIRLSTENCERKIEQLKNYFKVADWSIISDMVYRWFYQTDDSQILDLSVEMLVEHDEIKLDKCLEMIESDSITAAKYALKLLMYTKPFYSNSDFELLKKIQKAIVDEFEMTATLSKKKKMLSSAEVEVWTCVCGKTNDIDIEYCSGCWQDMYGFLKADTKVKEVLPVVSERVAVLKDMFSDEPQQA